MPGHDSYIFAIESCEVKEGCGRQLIVNKQSVAVFRYRGTAYAMDGICPHAGSPLGPGIVMNGTVECPWHGWRFALADGGCPDVAGLRQTVYPTHEENGAIFVKLTAPDADSAGAA
ncbi:MAG: Rieske (2Fe-2S) protein [Planctomycetes bacterium]|nr:Rieske (2Fe-2S) protein [Planctomycetota bacterium]